MSGGGCGPSDSGDCRLPDIREDQTPACEPLPSDRSLRPLAAQKTKNQPRYLRPAMKTWRILRRRGALETPLASFGSPAAPSLSSCCLTYLTPGPSPTPSSVPQPSVQTVHSDRSVIVTSSGYFFFIVNVWFCFWSTRRFSAETFFFLFSYFMSSSSRRDSMSRRRRLRRPPSGAFSFFRCLLSQKKKREFLQLQPAAVAKWNVFQDTEFTNTRFCVSQTGFSSS